LTLYGAIRTIDGNGFQEASGQEVPVTSSGRAAAESAFLAGAASLNVDPPLGLPMSGVVLRDEVAQRRVGSLEVSAAVFQSGSDRVVLCGVDTLAIQSPEVDELRERVARAIDADSAGVLLNWNHTHHAPPGSPAVYGSFGEAVTEPDELTLAYIEYLHARIVEVCRLACERLEPAWPRWGLGVADEAINRRERGPDGKVVFGWNTDGMADQSVTVLQALRQDGSAIATVVSFGCHTVTTGLGFIGYSPDYPGPLRDVVRSVTGGECVFFQAAGGNIMPRVAFDETGEATGRLGRRLATEALHAVAARPGWPAELEETRFRSGTEARIFRWRPVEQSPPPVAAREASVVFPLLPLPSPEEITRLREEGEAEIEAARARGATESELRILRFHGLNWARRAETEIHGGNPRRSARGSIHAVRIGDGAIVTGPGEIFTEIGLAVKERSAADVTLYAGYTNGCISYFPTAQEYPLGGYEPSYGNKTYGLPAQVTPECEQILIETGVDLVNSLFPEREAPAVPGWLATGRVPVPPEPWRLTRPASSDDGSV
jgi:neutral ceramidase